MRTDSVPTLIAALAHARAYPHPVGRIERLETHVSWVLLAGDRAYKIKKPVDFGFLDFSTLDARRRFCEEEIRLNRRLAPGLYLGVVPITGPRDAPCVGGDGTPIEYAVAMRRFPAGAQVDRVLADGRLAPRHIDALAQEIADFHEGAPRAPMASPWGSADEVLTHCEDNFRLIGALAELPADLRACLERLRVRACAEHARLAPLIAERRAAGFVRECHGDLHLRNMALIDDRIVAFDALEFSPALRWIDVVSEVAFTVMDLHHRERADLARRFLNGWLERSGDYSALALLPFFLSYRALVRAKVTALRAAQTEGVARADCLVEVGRMLSLAEHLGTAPGARLAITFGVSGSGKSRLAMRLVEANGWIRIRSDVERKRLVGLRAEARSGSPLDDGLYAADATEAAYGRIAELARIVITSGHPALVDATFLARRHRATMRALAQAAAVPFVILSVSAPPAVLRRRVIARMTHAHDASEATAAVLDRQLQRRETLDREEKAVTVEVDTTTDPSVSEVAAAVAARALGAAGAEP